MKSETIKDRCAHITDQVANQLCISNQIAMEQLRMQRLQFGQSFQYRNPNKPVIEPY